MVSKDKDLLYIFGKEYKTKMKRGQDIKYKTYGKVFILSTKTIKTILNILEMVIPMTFFILSFIGEYLYKKNWI